VNENADRDPERNGPIGSAGYAGDAAAACPLGGAGSPASGGGRVYFLELLKIVIYRSSYCFAYLDWSYFSQWRFIFRMLAR
jgi:hypothetical protein